MLKQKEDGVPDTYIDYIDAIAMMRDQIIDGEIAYVWVKMDGGDVAVLYYTE